MFCTNRSSGSKVKRGETGKNRRQHSDRNTKRIPFLFISFCKKGKDIKNRLSTNYFRIIVGSLHSRLINKDLSAVCRLCRVIDGPPCRVSNSDSGEMCSTCLSQQTEKKRKSQVFFQMLIVSTQNLSYSPFQK